jgi:multiple sugar transport system permease protein
MTAISQSRALSRRRHRPNEATPPARFLRHLMLIALAVLMFYPLLWLVGSSFRSNGQISDLSIWPGSGFTLQGYETGWQGIGGVEFWRFMLNSFLIAALCVAANLVACSLTAYAFARI